MIARKKKSDKLYFLDLTVGENGLSSSQLQSAKVEESAARRTSNMGNINNLPNFRLQERFHKVKGGGKKEVIRSRNTAP